MSLASLIVRIGADLGDYDRKLAQAERRIGDFGSKLSSIGQSLALGISAPLIGFGVAAVKSAADMEALEKGLAAVTKSAEPLNAQLGRLKEVAKLPGLGFREAVQGSINLQAAGFSAGLAERGLKAFGNALATVGKGRPELEGVITALTQIAAKGKVSAEEINQLQERLPQIRQAMKDAFGTADTEVLAKMGVDSQQFIEKIITQFEKLPPVTGGLKNDFENFRDTVEVALADAGKSIAPFASAVLNEMAIPLIGKLQELGREFGKMDQGTQAAAVSLGAVAAASPLVIVAVGTLIEKLVILRGVFAASPIGIALFVTSLGLAAIAASSLKRELEDMRLRMSAAADTAAEKATAANTHFGRSARTAREDVLNFAAALPSVSTGMRAVNTATVDLTKKKKEFTDATYKAATALLAKVDAAHEMTIAHRGLKVMIESVSAEVDRQTYALQLSQFAGVAAATAIAAAKRQMTVAVNGATAALQKQLKVFQDLDDAVEKFRQDQLRGIVDAMGERNMDASLDKAAKKNEDTARKVESVWDRAGRQISTITTDLGRSLMDLMTKGGKLKDVMADTFAEIGKSLLRSAIETQIRRVTGAVLDLISKSGVLGKVLGSVFGGGASAAAGGIGQAAGGAAGAAGSIGGGAASAGSAAASGIMGTIGAIGSIGSMVSGIIGNFQFAGMNKSLDLIEKEVRYSQIHLLGLLEKANEFWPYAKNNNDAIWTMRDTLLDPVTATLERILTALGSLKIEGGMPVVIQVDGKVLAQTVVRELKLAGL